MNITQLPDQQEIHLFGYAIPRWLLPPVYTFLVSRSVVFFAAYFADIMINTGIEENFYHLSPNNRFLDVFARWDSKFYIDIAENGYEYVIGQVSNVAFFPLYPLLVSMINSIINNLVLSGILVSHISFLIALIYLYRLTLLICEDSAIAQRTIFYIALFPTAFFFSAVYTESLFLLVSVAAVYHAKKQEWGFAAIFVMLSSVTRITGLLMFGVVGLEWMQSHHWTIRRSFSASAWQHLWAGIKKDWFNLTLILLAPLGLLSHIAFLQNQFQDPFAFWTVQQAFNRTSEGVIAILVRDFGPVLSQNFLQGEIWWNVTLDTAAFLAALISAPFVYRRFGEGFTLYILLSILIPISSGTGSMIRYILVLFPIFMLLAILGKKEPVDRLIQAAFPLFLGILTAVFVNWIFVA